MPIDIQKMFSDLMPNPETEDVLKGELLARNISNLGSGFALQQPAVLRSMRRGAGNLLGVDTRTPAERLQEQLRGVDMTTPAGQQQAIEIINQVDPTKALQLRVALQEQARAQQLTNAQSTAADASMMTAQTRAFEAVNPRPMSPNDRFATVGKNIWDNAEQKWIVPPSEGTGTVEIEKIDPDQYDPSSFGRYQTAVANAETEQDRRDALDILLPKAPENWKYVKSERDDKDFVLKPVGEDLMEVRKEIDAANRSGQTQKRRSEDLVDYISQMEEAVENGTAETGIAGVVLRNIPQTDEYTLQGDLDTVLANLGYNALQEARANSASGASGFGQLTERELQRLESLVRNLNQGMKKEDFLLRLKDVKQDFERAAQSAKTDWTVDQWLGIEAPPEPTADDVQEITTPSGSTYRVRKVQ